MDPPLKESSSGPHGLNYISFFHMIDLALVISNIPQQNIKLGFQYPLNVKVVQ